MMPNAAFEIVSTALKNGKDVVSASKKMIAEHLPELLQLQQETGQSFFMKPLPVLLSLLSETWKNIMIMIFYIPLRAIVNGSTNFILTKMFEEKLDFKQALLLAQQLGFAESNPTLDVEGYDAVNKWTFLLTHAYGIVESSG